MFSEALCLSAYEEGLTICIRRGWVERRQFDLDFQEGTTLSKAMPVADFMPSHTDLQCLCKQIQHMRSKACTVIVLTEYIPQNLRLAASV